MDKLLLKLINSFGISGKEDEIRQVIKESLKESDHDIHEDNIGNILVKVGTGKNKVMICSNMDSVGFIVNDIEEDGMIKVNSIGEFNTQDISHSFIRFHNGTLGKVCTSSKGVFVDIGTSNREDTLKKIKEGDMASLVGPYLKVGNNNIISPLLHNKVGCYILLKLLESIEINDIEFNFVFASQGEIGGIGARIAANTINPDYCIIVGVENTKNKEETKIDIGDGPVLKIMDSSLIMHKDIKDILENAAERADVKFQYSISTSKSQGGLVHKERIGIRTGEIAVPCRYKYSTSEMISIYDIENTIKVLNELENFKELI
ncbi:hydrolase [Clostridium kluyveri]|uniref:Hydrolase n=1 Tax=Clostridium kluyveri TaxID=1534 RepID=A0A1L5FDK8_CLOKL|nr:hydrolase [Clostridium kluyveri]APM41102.1 hydrolase [Clostridium kluyveri]